MAGARRSVFGLLKQALVFVHRYLGIPMSIVFVVWFASGVVMIYTGGMPAIAESERLARAPALDLRAVSVTPADAVQTAGFAPERMHLVTVMGRPAWRLETARGGTTVFADSGELLDAVTPERARRIAAAYTGMTAGEFRNLDTLERPDQWTLTLADRLPLIKLAAADPAGTQVYVSVYEAEVALVTGFADRALAWAGAIPHWFYVTPLRTNQPAWYWSVVVTSIVGTVLAVIGLVLGLADLRWRRRRTGPASVFPYRGWMHWHHVLGLVFGLFVLTWVFSGLLSMDPFDWTRIEGAARPDARLGAGRIDAADFGRIDAAHAEAARSALGVEPKALELVEAAGVPLYLVRAAEGARSALLDAESLEPRTRPFATGTLLRRLEASLDGAGIGAWTLLTDYDAYYYARDGAAPLPVLRVELDDPGRTRVYIDATRARIVARFNRRERVERWLYYGLHSLDFGFWYDRRPLWDIGMIVLSLGGLATSGAGLVLGLRRIRRFLARRSARRRARSRVA